MRKFERLCAATDDWIIMRKDTRQLIEWEKRNVLLGGGADVKGRRCGDVTPLVQVRGSMRNKKEHKETSYCTLERRPKTKWLSGQRCLLIVALDTGFSGLHSSIDYVDFKQKHLTSNVPYHKFKLRGRKMYEENKCTEEFVRVRHRPMFKVQLGYGNSCFIVRTRPGTALKCRDDDNPSFRRRWNGLKTAFP
jgi:hypothetical protein